MVRWLLSLILNAVALVIADLLFDSFYLESFGTAVLASLVLAVLNVLIKPILIILTLPVTVMTLGLFLFIINAITLMIAQALLGESFIIDGFGNAILAAIVLALINLLLNRLIRDRVADNRS